jgi:uncharacterized protein
VHLRSTLIGVTFSLRRLRLLPGEEHVERQVVALEPVLLGGQVYAPAPAEVDTVLVIQRATSGYAFRLRFGVEVAGPCMRCLDDTAVSLAIDAREYHDLDPDGDDELVSDYVTDDIVRLADWARDAIVLTLPDPILCRPDCAGLCPVCGKNLNVEPHEHDEVRGDPRWAALESLTLDE